MSLCVGRMYSPRSSAGRPSLGTPITLFAHSLSLVPVDDPNSRHVIGWQLDADPVIKQDACASPPNLVP